MRREVLLKTKTKTTATMAMKKWRKLLALQFLKMLLLLGMLLLLLRVGVSQSSEQDLALPVVPSNASRPGLKRVSQQFLWRHCCCCCSVLFYSTSCVSKSEIKTSPSHPMSHSHPTSHTQCLTATERLTGTKRKITMKKEMGRISRGLALQIGQPARHLRRMLFEGLDAKQ